MLGCLFLLGCDPGVLFPEPKIVYLYVESDELKLYGSDPSGNPDPKTVLQSITTPLSLEAEYLGYIEQGQKWVSVEIQIADESHEGWVLASNVFSNSTATLYYFSDTDINDGVRLSSQNADASAIIDYCFYHIAEQALFEKRKADQYRTKYETKAEHKARISKMDSLPPPPFRKRTAVKISLISSAYDAEKQKYSILYPDENITQRKLSEGNSTCADTLGYIGSKERGYDNDIYTIDYYTKILLNYKAPLIPIRKTKITKGDYTNEELAIRYVNVEPKKAKLLDSKGMYLIEGYKLLADPEISKPPSHRSCFLGRVGSHRYCAMYHTTSYSADIEYQIIYTVAGNQSVVKAQSKNYTTERLIRDIKVLLLQSNYEVGELNGENNRALKVAIDKAFEKGAIKSREIGLTLLAELLLTSDYKPID